MKIVNEQKISYWDSQFKFSAILQDFEQSLDWNKQQSALLSRNQRATHHPYAAHPRQFVETFGESGTAIIPVFIHGGYWRALEASEHRFTIPGLQHIGSLVANVEYRLMPEVRLAEVVDDVARALSFLVEKYCQSGAKLLLIGHSAGGHLAIAGALQAENSEQLHSVVSISGLYDLAPLKFSFLQQHLKLTTAEIEHYSLVKAAEQLPFKLHLVVGENESAEFHRQAQMMKSCSGGKLTVVKAAHHISVLQPLAEPRSELVDIIFS